MKYLSFPFPDERRMLQYLTSDLLPGYGLPKKRMAVYVWSLLDSVISCRGVICCLQQSDVVAIGQEINEDIVYALHADGRINAIGASSYQRLNLDNLHCYLE
jgi:hypothetical protein